MIAATAMQHATCLVAGIGPEWNCPGCTLGRPDDGCRDSVSAAANTEKGRQTVDMTAGASGIIPNITIEDLVVFGAEALAAILLDCAGRDIDLLDRLRLSVAARKGPDALAAVAASRIQALIDDRTFYDWRTAGTLADRIGHLGGVIADGFEDPEIAAGLLADLVAASNSVMTGVDDSSGRIGGAFGDAVAAWGAAWAKVPDRDTEALATLVLREIDTDDYGVKHGVLLAFREALGPTGLVTLRGLIRSELGKDTSATWRWPHALQQIADGLGDVDGFIAAVEAGGRPERQAVDVASRLVAAQRPGEALDWLDRADTGTGLAADVRIDALSALGRMEEARIVRWKETTEYLRLEHYRIYAEALAVDEREVVLQLAVAAAMVHNDIGAAIAFLLDLPDEAAAERLVVTRYPELDGRCYATLLPLADRLAERHPLASVLLYRVLAEAILDARRSPAYRHAAAYICIANRLSVRIVDWQGHEPPVAFMARIQDIHRRKSAFWPALANAEQCEP